MCACADCDPGARVGRQFHDFSARLEVLLTGLVRRQRAGYQRGAGRAAVSNLNHPNHPYKAELADLRRAQALAEADSQARTPRAGAAREKEQARLQEALLAQAAQLAEREAGLARAELAAAERAKAQDANAAAHQHTHCALDALQRLVNDSVRVGDGVARTLEGLSQAVDRRVLC